MGRALDLDQVQAFLVLCEELHFGRTAERIYRSQPRVSRLIATLEAEIGAPLFERTNRRVKLTPLGLRFEARLRPAYVELLASRDVARQDATGTEGTLRIAFTAATEGPALARLVDSFSHRYLDCAVSLLEVGIASPYDVLRSGEADVLYNWLAVDEPDLTHSVPIEHQARMLAVSANDPLAGHQTVRVEQLAGRRVLVVSGIPTATIDLFYPSPVLAEAVGRTLAEPIDSPYRVRSAGEAWMLIARGQAIHATVASMTSKLARDDIALLPITDLPPLPLGLIWKRTNENARIRAFVTAAEALTASRGKPAKTRLGYDRM